MGIFFKPAEMFDVAIGLEKNGISFYSEALKNSRNSDVKSLFDFLIASEKSHLQFFQKLKESQGSTPSPEPLDEEYELYVKALISSVAFTPEKNSEAIKIARSGVEIQVLNLALGMERDSILFYLEMKPLMAVTGKGAIDKIILEERSHLEKLSTLKDIFSK